MRTLAIIAALALCGFAEPKAVDSWNGGPKTPAYHRVVGDCEAVWHGHGRNAVYGAWSMPLAEVTFKASGKMVEASCKDGSACIKAGLMEDLSNRIASHAMPFETEADAQAMVAHIEGFRASCKG